MDDFILDRTRTANAKLHALIDRTRAALAGRNNFTAEDVRAIAEPVAQMTPIVAESKHLRTLQPELEGELESYAGNLDELQTALEQMRFMLLSRLANVQALRGHLESVGLWATRLRQTQ
jgi:hypothetical protein